MTPVWLTLAMVAVVSLRLAVLAGDALGRAVLRRRLRDPRNAYLQHFR